MYNVTAQGNEVISNISLEDIVELAKERMLECGDNEGVNILSSLTPELSIPWIEERMEWEIFHSEKESLEKEFNTVFFPESLREQIFNTAKNFADISEDHPQANSLGLTLHSFYEEIANIALNAYNEGHG